MSELAVTALADRPRPTGGPSAPHGRTVRSYVFHTTRDQQRLWNNFEVSLRTVRALGADRPQFTFQPKPEKQPLWYKTEISRRTVRAPWVDCLPFNFEAHQRDTLSVTILKYSGGPSAHLGRTVRKPTKASASSLERSRTVRPSGADCPTLLSQLSILRLFQIFSKRH